MRILVISDIHANLEALEAVLKDTVEVDAIWCLGDLVGYGPNPNECIERIAQLPNLVCLIGNHDAAALDLIDVDSFNPEARHAILWTQSTLSEASIEYLNSLPERVVSEDVTLVHGSPRQPVWEYLLDTRAATQNFAYFDTPFCFVGHSHLPIIYRLGENQTLAELILPEINQTYQLTTRAILNPGSVGQPRDRDPRASYAVYDSEEQTWRYFRVSYDIQKVQTHMQEIGLPQRHIQRLKAGW
jgi:predicted phosphodiesterase